MKMSDCTMHVANIVFTGKGPFKKRFSQEDYEKIVKYGKLPWGVINEEMCPILQARVAKNAISVTGGQKHQCVSFWVGGKFIITGVVSRKEAEELYDKVIKDIKQAMRR